MASVSIPQFSGLIHQQIQSREQLDVYLSKVEALASLALSDDFCNYSDKIKYHYLWTLRDIVEQAKQGNEEALEQLLRQG